VRHPLERLLSAWRFLFHSQAWKQMLVNRTDLVALHGRLLGLSWPGFVAEILLGRAGRRGLTPSRLQGCYSETGFHITIGMDRNFVCLWRRYTIATDLSLSALIS
jgi:hypothetical protein